MAKSSINPMRSRLERARSAQNGIRLVRSIPDADVIEAYVLEVGSKWVLMAAVQETRLDGYVAVRIRDIERIQPLRAEAFFRKASEQAGVWPPVLPADPIDLSTTRSLIETAHVHATLVNLQIEREDPNGAFIGVPTRWTPKKLWLHEVSPQAIWDDTDSKWPFSDITYFSWLVPHPTGEHPPSSTNYRICRCGRAVVAEMNASGRGPLGHLRRNDCLRLLAGAQSTAWDVGTLSQGQAS